MATTPKLPPHRLGWRQAPDPEPQEFARWIFLDRLTEMIPAVLDDLEAAGDDGPAVEAWAARWHVSAPWVLSHARATRRAWRRMPASPRCWHDRDDQPGELIASPLPPARESRPLKDAEHFRWFVRYQVLGERYAAIAASAGRDVTAVETAVKALRTVLDLPLRPTRRGRPARLA